MACDLHRHFGALAVSVRGAEKPRYVFSAQNFGELPSNLESDSLIIEKGSRAYESFRVDWLRFFAHKETYQQLGLLILHVVFRPGGSRVHLALTNETSHIKNLIVEYPGVSNRYGGLRTRPDHFRFSQGDVRRHPWSGQRTEVLRLPTFRLTNLKDILLTEEHWAQRDTVMGFGNDDGNVLLADLLLQFGAPQNTNTDEIDLEGEGGFRGVGLHSAEASFYLPGSFAWPKT